MSDLSPARLAELRALVAAVGPERKLTSSAPVIALLDALLADAPDLLAAAEERDRLRAEVERLDGVVTRAQHETDRWISEALDIRAERDELVRKFRELAVQWEAWSKDKLGSPFGNIPAREVMDYTANGLRALLPEEEK